MSETEFYQWRLFYPLISSDEKTPFTLRTKLKMLLIQDEKHSNRFYSRDFYLPLINGDVALKFSSIDDVSHLKIDLEIRNRQNEISSSNIEHWSRYELKSPKFDLTDKVLARLDSILIEQIQEFLQRFVQEPTIDDRCIELEKNSEIWSMDETDRQIEETDFNLKMFDQTLSTLNSSELNVPSEWRTIAIQTSDHHQLTKTLTTLQIDDDKDLFDYLTFLLSQTRFRQSFYSENEENEPNSSLLRLSSEKIYMNLLTMSYASFIELIRRMHINPSSRH